MSEVGLTIEVWHEENGDIIFDPEITPNRPDWMSITGIAREVAAATGAKFTPPKTIATPEKVKNPLQLNYKDDPTLCPRTSRILIRNVKVKSSPEWLQKRIKQIGLRPINNLVDITNYVLWLYGNPLHVFDYDKIRGHSMTAELSKGGEEFRSLESLAAGKGVKLLCCAAAQEVEVWLLAGHVSELGRGWSDVTSDRSVKENVFDPFLAVHGDPRRPGAGRDLLMKETLQNYSGLLGRCTELHTLQERIKAALGS